MCNAIEKLSVVIPVFNAENHIRETINQLLSFFTSQQIPYEIILVDDNSTDKTTTVLNELIQVYSNISVAENTKNIGQDSSTLKGLQLCTGNFALIIDDDFEYPVGSISAMIDLISIEDADLVYGIPENKKSAVLRKMAHTISHQLLRLTGYENASNYKLLNGDLLNNLHRTAASKSFSIDKFLLKNSKKTALLKIDNTPDNRSRYNLRKLVIKFLNFIFHSN